MSEFDKHKNSAMKVEEKNGFTVSTIERGNVQTNHLDPNDRAEYFESALEETTFGKFNYFLIFVSGLILENVIIETYGISFVLPASQCDLNLSIQESGILGAIGIFGAICSSPLWGFLADTKGRRNVIRPTLLLGFLATVLSSFAINFWMLVILRFMNGFFISAGAAVTYAFLGEFHTNKNRSRAIMGSSVIFAVVGLFMPALAWLVINQEWQFIIPILGITYKPWRLFIGVCGIPGLICGLCLYKIPESPKFHLAQGNEKKCLEILQRIFHMNTGKPISDYQITRVIKDLDTNMMLSTKIIDEPSPSKISTFLRTIWNQTQPLFNRKYLRTTVLLCCIQFGLYIPDGVYIWFPYIYNTLAEFTNNYPGNHTTICQAVYLKQQNMTESEIADIDIGASSAQSMLEQCSEKLDISTFEYSFILGVLYSLGFALIGVMITKAEKMTILFVCLSVCGACGIIIVFINLPTVSTYLFLTLNLFGLGVNVLGAAIIDLYPTKLRAMAVCIPQMVGRLGSVVGTNVVAAIINSNCETAFIGTGATLIISGLLGFFVSKPKQSL